MSKLQYTEDDLDLMGFKQIGQRFEYKLLDLEHHTQTLILEMADDDSVLEVSQIHDVFCSVHSTIHIPMPQTVGDIYALIKLLEHGKHHH